MSKGQKIEDKVSVPDVRSKTKSGAQSELKAAGLKVSIKKLTVMMLRKEKLSLRLHHMEVKFRKIQLL